MKLYFRNWRNTMSIRKFIASNGLAEIFRLAYYTRHRRNYIRDEKSKYKTDQYKQGDIEMLKVYAKYNNWRVICKSLEKEWRKLMNWELYDDMIRCKLLFDYDLSYEYQKL